MTIKALQAELFAIKTESGLVKIPKFQEFNLLMVQLPEYCLDDLKWCWCHYSTPTLLKTGSVD